MGASVAEKNSEMSESSRRCRRIDSRRAKSEFEIVFSYIFRIRIEIEDDDELATQSSVLSVFVTVKSEFKLYISMGKPIVRVFGVSTLVVIKQS